MSYYVFNAVVGVLCGILLVGDLINFEKKKLGWIVFNSAAAASNLTVVALHFFKS
jgi:hypothetical protein